MRVSNTTTDSLLVSQYINGNQQSFQILLSRHQAKIFGYIFSKVKNHSIADDIFQEVFIKVINNLNAGKYNDEGKFLPWVMRISHNMVIDHFRKEKKMKMVRDKDDFSIFDIITKTEGSIEDQLVKEQLYAEIKEAITKLSDNQRNIVEKRIFCKMSFSDIAEEEGISINTALGRMRYALINLRKVIKDSKIEIFI